MQSWLTYKAIHRVGAGLALGSFASFSPSLAQPEDKSYRPPEATIYRDAAFLGPALFVDRANPDLGLAWPVNSIRVKRGKWELCERTRYRGRCRIAERDTSVLNNPLRGLTIQSIRPVGGGGGGWEPAPPAGGQTARGSFAEFRTQPTDGGYRVQACRNASATAACAAQTADQWCRSIGWNGSAREHMETVAGRVYLADVLCVRSGY